MTKWTFISKYIWQLLFWVSICIIFLIDTCRKPCQECPPCPDIDTTKTEIIYPDTFFIPGEDTIIYKDRIIVTWEQLEVDTQAILDMYVDYFAEVVYRREFLNDTNGYLIVTDTVSENRIKNTYVEKKFYPTIIKITNTIKEEYLPRNEFYAGMGVGGSKNSFGAEVTGMFVNKKKRAYTLSYDFVQSEVKVGVMFKIF
jgi:hypothetical protein